MSDILIRGMEMPEHCGECKLKAEYDDETFCPFFADNVEYWIAAGRRHEDCPLGYIQPHGDLIDRDVLRAEFPEPNEENGGWRNPDEALVHKTGVWAAIDDAPTIIPASE